MDNFVFVFNDDICYTQINKLSSFFLSARNSHISRVRGLVVRCLFLNPEGSCSNRAYALIFFTSIPKQKDSTFMSPKAPLQFFDILQQNDLKIPKGHFFQIFRLCETVQNSHFFRNFCKVSKGSENFSINSNKNSKLVV